MALRRKQCRDHGGIFSYHPRRGTQPVRCKPETPCDRYEGYEGEAARQAERASKFEKPPTRFQGPCPECGGTGGHAGSCSHSGLKPSNPCLPLAKAAKERLTVVGWVVQGRGWIDDSDEESNGPWAEITASRDQETLIMKWHGGYLVSQDYSMAFEKPSTNNYPDNDLHFDPAELSDSELVRMVKGMKVTWWNTIAGSKETAIIGGTVTIEHIFFTNGDEDNSKRIVKFIDHGGGGFRAFHVSALLKVG